MIFLSTSQNVQGRGAFSEEIGCVQEGVLTIGLGSHGTYVLNKQAPNKQIWSSSPVSGPARYDWQDGKWVYKRGGIELFQTLSEEMSQLLGTKVDLHDS